MWHKIRESPACDWKQKVRTAVTTWADQIPFILRSLTRNASDLEVGCVAHVVLRVLLRLSWHRAEDPGACCQGRMCAEQSNEPPHGRTRRLQPHTSHWLLQTGIESAKKGMKFPECEYVFLNLLGCFSSVFLPINPDQLHCPCWKTRLLFWFFLPD